MKINRLHMLLLALGGVIFVRVWDPLTDHMQAATNKSADTQAIHNSHKANLAQEVATPAEVTVGQLTWPIRGKVEVDPIRDAFAVPRTISPPPLPPKQPETKPQGHEYGPPRPPTPPAIVDPAPPFKVIGTLGLAPGVRVFLAGAHGTLLASEGDVLQSSFKVQSISPNKISLIRMNDGYVWNIGISTQPSTQNITPELVRN